MKRSLFFALLACVSVMCKAQKGYHIRKTFSIASAGKWDYIRINPVTHNIYVSHETRVNVLSPTGDSVGVIPNTPGVHGIAFATDFGKGFTSNGRANTVTEFDMRTNAVLKEIKTGENPDAIMYDPVTKIVIVCNGRSNDLTIINPATDDALIGYSLGGKPEEAVADGNGHLYINLEDKNEIVVLDEYKLNILARWPLGKAEGPTGLSIDTKTRRLFAGCEKALVVLNADNGKIVTEIPIGEGCDGTAFDAELKEIFASCGDGTLGVIKEVDANTYQLVENAKTQKGARTLTLDKQQHLLYLPTADFKRLSEEEKAKHQRPEMIPGSFKVLVVGK